MIVVQINYTCDRDLVDPELLLARYWTLTEWSDVLTLWNAGGTAGFAHALEGACRQDLDSARAPIVRHFERTLSWTVIGRRAMDIYGEVIAARCAAYEAAGGC